MKLNLTREYKENWLILYGESIYNIYGITKSFNFDRKARLLFGFVAFMKTIKT